MPSLLTMEVLKEESAYDAEMFVDASMKRVGELFGVDAVLFTIIHEWARTTIASQIKVKIEYILKSTKTDEVLFSRTGTIVYAPNNSNDNSFLGLVINMVSTALTKEIVVGRQCNSYTLSDIPEGKYAPLWGEDGQAAAGTTEFSVTLQ